MKTHGDEGREETAQEKYWREHHEQSAHKDAPFEHFEPAYRTAAEGVKKYPGKHYHEIESDLARDYDKNDANLAIPWDRARPAVKSAWDRLGGVMGPRDTDRGLRGGI
jgi:hypothetical protein